MTCVENEGHNGGLKEGSKRSEQMKKEKETRGREGEKMTEMVQKEVKSYDQCLP